MILIFIKNLVCKKKFAEICKDVWQIFIYNDRIHQYLVWKKSWKVAKIFGKYSYKMIIFINNLFGKKS